jgi:extradiol dioxygenase family protein
VFTNLQPGDGVLLQFAEPPVEIQMQHYAFLLDDELFNQAYSRLRDRGIEHWADPQMRRAGEITTSTPAAVSTSRPAGHAIELITRRHFVAI